MGERFVDEVITPVEHFAGWDPDVVHGLAWGRRQLAQLAGPTTLGIADSAFNEQELVELETRLTQLERSVSMAAEELSITEPLAAKRVVARVDLLRLRRGERHGARRFVGDRLRLRDERARDRRAEEVGALVHGVRAEHRKQEVAHELLAQVDDVHAARPCAMLRRTLPVPCHGRGSS